MLIRRIRARLTETDLCCPKDIQLPRINLSSSYIFAYNTDFLVYNNDANRFIRYYRNTFQHGGISMEEMIVPYIVLKPKL